MNAFRGCSAIVLIFLWPTFLSATPPVPTLDEVQASHIEGNVPPYEEFDKILQRDLLSYFSRGRTDVSEVQFDLLRSEPTQSGTAYPKFYAWIKIYSGIDIIGEGAVRLAAIERTRFDITSYFSKDDIRRNPNQLLSVFPAALVGRIRSRAGAIE